MKRSTTHSDIDSFSRGRRPHQQQRPVTLSYQQLEQGPNANGLYRGDQDLVGGDVPGDGRGVGEVFAPFLPVPATLFGEPVGVTFLIS